jgi:hypothetical protein
MALNIPVQGKEYFCFHALKTCLDIATGILCVTLTSQVVVYTQPPEVEFKNEQLG